MENFEKQKNEAIEKHLEAIKTAFNEGQSGPEIPVLPRYLLNEADEYNIFIWENAIINDLMGLDEMLDYQQLFYVILNNRNNIKFALYILFRRLTDIENIKEIDNPSLFQSFIENLLIQPPKFKNGKWALMRVLELGYEFKESDKKYIQERFHKLESKNSLAEQYWMASRLAIKLNNLDDLKYALDHYSFKKIQTLVSFKIKKPFGIGLKNLVAIANNALYSYTNNGELFLRALEKYNLYDLITGMDKNGSFQRKLEAYKSNKPDQDLKFEKLVHKLLPELQ